MSLSSQGLKPHIQRLYSYSSALSITQLRIALLGIALTLTLSTLNRGLQSDDYLHRQMLLEQDTSFSQQTNGFFEFLGPSLTLPWWTDPNLKIKFWRPLSAMTHWFDYQLWPQSPLLMHIHNAVWYLILVNLIFIFFLKLFNNKELAFLASLLFCIDFSHFANISWIANRNSLIASCFILISLISYMHWRDKKHLLYLAGSLTSFLLALLSAESSISVVPIILAIEIFLQQKQSDNIRFTIKNLLVGLSGFLLIAGVWQFYYQTLAFGSANNSMYFSPAQDLIHGFGLVLLKLPVFIFGNLIGTEGFFNVLSFEGKILVSTSCALLITFMLANTKELFKIKQYQFLCFAALIPLIPVSFVAVLDMRLGLYASIFSAGLLAFIFKDLLEETNLGGKNISRLKSALLICLFASHLIIGPLQWLNVGIKDWTNPPNSFSQLKNLKIKHPNKNIFVFNYPSPIDAYYFPFTSFENEAIKDNNKGNIFILNNNLSDYDLSVNLNHQIELNSTQGFVFTNSDIQKLDRDLPMISGIYARAAFNGILPWNYQFSAGNSYFHNNFVARINSINNQGLASELIFSFPNSDSKNQYVFWDTQGKIFKTFFLSELKQNRTVLQFKNW